VYFVLVGSLIFLWYDTLHYKVGNPEEGERPSLEAVARQRLVKTVMDRGRRSVCGSDM
jgi:hypothetical protein